jgi:hypothetical protein
MIATLTDGTELPNVRGYEIAYQADRHPYVHRPATEQKVNLIQTNQPGLRVEVTKVESIEG